MSDIVRLAKARGIRVIEDCAHVLPGSTHDGKPLGTWGDAAYFSFERGKTISSGWGGAAVAQDETLGQRLQQIQHGVPSLSRDDNLRISARLFLTLLTHDPDLFALVALLRGSLSKKGVFPNTVPPEECRGEPPKQPLGRLADIQGSLLLRQIKRLPSISARRRSCVSAFAERLNGLRRIFHSCGIHSRYETETKRWSISENIKSSCAGGQPHSRRLLAIQLARFINGAVVLWQRKLAADASRSRQC